MAGKRELARIGSILEFLILAVIICLCLLLIVPKAAGLQLFTVVSGSMEPEIPVGSVIFAQTEDPANLAEGDVVVFQSAGGSVISHRVVKNKVISGEIVTKGDANEQEDPAAIVYSQVIGKEVFCIPRVGGILAAITTTAGKIALICVIGLTIVMHVVRERFLLND